MAPPHQNCNLSKPSKLENLEDSSIFPALMCLENTVKDKGKNFTEKVSIIVSICPSVAEFIITQPLSKSVTEQVIEIIFYAVAEVILNCRWLKKDTVTKNHVIFTLNKFLNHAKAINSINHPKLMAYLILLVKDPWGNLTLKKIMRDEELKSGGEVKRFFQRETIVLISLRVLSLIESECEDLALKLVSFVIKYCGLPIKSNINAFIRITSNVINQIEVAKKKGNHNRVREIEKKLCSIFLVLFSLFRECKGLSREIILTAFSLQPNDSVFKLIKLCYERDSSESYSSDSKDKSNNDKRTIACGALTPETGLYLTNLPDYDPLSAPSDAINDCEMLGLTKENTSDLVSIISYPRYKRLSWMYDWETLRATCEDYMKNSVSMKNPKIKLKHLNIDFSLLLNRID